MAEPTSDKRIIIDEDWKEEAQREKETLAKALESQRQAAEPPPPPEASFNVLASSLAIQAMAGLGDLQDAKGQATPVRLPEAKFHIDLLEMLQTKTKGNLDAEESKMLDSLLFDLRLRYVERSRPNA